MNIAFFHGLESPAVSDKSEWLNSTYKNVYTPAMDYRDPGLFNRVLKEVKDRKIDLLVGSSMGGWFAYCISTLTGIPTVLFNPAFHSRSFDPSVGIGGRGARHTVVLGKKDDLIDPATTQEWIKNNGKGKFTVHMEGNGHRTPIGIFTKYLSGLKESQSTSKHVKLFEEWAAEENSTNESLASAVAKFSNWISMITGGNKEKTIDDITIVNPDTKKDIKLTSALKKDDNTTAKKVANAFMDEYKKDDKKESKDSVLQKGITDEIEKRGKKYKEEYKEYDQEWTKEDDRNLRNEVLIDFYKGAEDVETKRKIEDAIIDAKDIKPRDYAVVARTFDNEGVDRAIEKLGKEKIDALLEDPSGNGQELGELILRSKNATPEQRQKAIMFQWVESPTSPGALLAAEHLSDKIGMGKKAKDGLAYRQDQGESFDKRAYGGIRDDVKKENLKAIDDIYNKTQEHFKKNGIKDIEVYRGSDEKDPDKYENPIESWTVDPEVGKNYGEYTHKKKVPVERIFTGHFDKGFPDPYAFGATDKDGNPIMSKEIVVLGK